MRCAHCGAVIPASSVDADQLLAKCDACNHVFRVEASSLPSTESPTLPRAPTPPALPRGIAVERLGSELEEEGAPPHAAYRDTARERPPGTLRLTRRWRSPASIALVLFALFWDGFLVLWYAIALAARPIQWTLLVFPMLHVAAGVGITYAAAMNLFNRTVVEVDSEQLRVRHGPLPWRGGRTVPTRAIKQVYVRRRHAGRAGAPYSVRAALEDLSTVELLSALRSLDQARYVEWAVEDFLRIESDPEYDAR